MMPGWNDHGSLFDGEMSADAGADQFTRNAKRDIQIASRCRMPTSSACKAPNSTARDRRGRWQSCDAGQEERPGDRWEERGDQFTDARFRKNFNVYLEIIN
jgi:hypothetical protein